MTWKERWKRIGEQWYCLWNGHNVVGDWYAYEDIDAEMGAGIRAVGTVYHPLRKWCLDCPWTWESGVELPEGTETFERIEGRRS